MDNPPPNPFLHRLLSHGSATLAKIQDAKAVSAYHFVVLAPVTSAFSAVDRETGKDYGELLEEPSFLDSHVLQIPKYGDRHERARARVYPTLDGKTIVVKDEAIYPHRGFKGVKEVKLLHDALFWLDDHDARPVLVYFIDRPLVGSPSSDKGSPVSKASPRKEAKPITSWPELCKRYPLVASHVDNVLNGLFADFRDQIHSEVETSFASGALPVLETPGLSEVDGDLFSAVVEDEVDARLLEDIVPRRREGSSSVASSINGGPPVTADSATNPVLVALRGEVDNILSGAIKAFTGLQQSLLHRLGTETGLTGAEVEGMLERYVMTELYDLIFFKVSQATREADEDVAAAVVNCKHVDVSQLGTLGTRGLRERIRVALGQFREFGTRQSPQGKLEALLATIDILMRGTASSADDLIPLLLAVVLRADVSNLLANLTYIREFSFLDTEGGENGFAISTLEAVIYHITSARRSLASVSRLNRAFFARVVRGDIAEIRRVVQQHPDVLEVRDLDDQTPHLRAPTGKVLLALLELPCTSSNLSRLPLRHFDDDALFDAVLDRALELDDGYVLLRERDDKSGQTIAHRLHDRPELIDDLAPLLDWRARDAQGYTPLQVLTRVYDHKSYDTLLADALGALTRIAVIVRLEDHVDPKGNTLAHVVGNATVVDAVLEHCTGDFDACNEKGLTPLLTAAKFARLDVLGRLLAHPKVDNYARDSRGNAVIHYAARGSLAMFNLCVRHGLSIDERTSGQGLTPLHVAAREGNLPIVKRLLELNPADAWDHKGLRPGDLVRNDQVRHLLDEWSCRGSDARVLRPHVVDEEEQGSRVVRVSPRVKYLVKCRSGGGVLRSVDDFTALRAWLASRYPDRAIPRLDLSAYPDPLALASKLARSVTQTVGERLDAVLQFLLDDTETSQHPLLWEFILSPGALDKAAFAGRLDVEMSAVREKVWREETPLTDFASAETFFAHAAAQLEQVRRCYDAVSRDARLLRAGQLNLAVSFNVLAATLEASPQSRAIDVTGNALSPRDPSPMQVLSGAMATTALVVQGLLDSLSLPGACVAEMRTLKATIERCEQQSKRWSSSSSLSLDAPSGIGSLLNIGILTDARARQRDRLTAELRHAHDEMQRKGCELRRLEGVLADGLSDFWQRHERHVRSNIQVLARRQLAVERDRLGAMQRAIKAMRR